MAGTGLLALIDDIATLLDDVAVMSKLAAKKTAGVVGDDLALNVQLVSGVKADRELPVVWAVAKGSLLNKFILVPAALLISWLAPWAVMPLLMLGGAFLCYEGMEKVLHRFLHKKPAHDDGARTAEAVEPTASDLAAFEKAKIRGAIRTDFILSAEIIVITLGTVATSPFLHRLSVLTIIALGITVVVYGFVAGIIKLDDLGLYLSQRPGEHWSARAKRSLGRGIIAMAPWLMKTLSIVGTAAMFLVGGSILLHGIPPLAHAIEAMLPAGGWGLFLQLLAEGLFGALAGLLLVPIVAGITRLFKRPPAAPATPA